MSYDVGTIVTIVTVLISVFGAFWRASQVFVTKESFNKRCDDVDEDFDKLSERQDRLDERQQRHEILTARLETSISGLERAVNGLTHYLSQQSIQTPHCAVATDTRRGGEK